MITTTTEAIEATPSELAGREVPMQERARILVQEANELRDIDRWSTTHRLSLLQAQAQLPRRRLYGQLPTEGTIQTLDGVHGRPMAGGVGAVVPA